MKTVTYKVKADSPPEVTKAATAAAESEGYTVVSVQGASETTPGNWEAIVAVTGEAKKTLKSILKPKPRKKTSKKKED